MMSSQRKKVTRVTQFIGKKGTRVTQIPEMSIYSHFILLDKIIQSFLRYCIKI
jgi:hypothetical protein